MATLSAILLLGDEANQKTSALAATTSSGEIVLGNNCIFAINADQDITIRAGNSGMGAAVTTDYRIPANQQTTLDTGVGTDRIRVFNQGASAANIYVKKLSKF